VVESGGPEAAFGQSAAGSAITGPHGVLRDGPGLPPPGPYRCPPTGHVHWQSPARGSTGDQAVTYRAGGCKLMVYMADRSASNRFSG
jgi:hypothetical protein